MVNHDHLYPLANVKLSYSASLFIHTIRGIADHVKSKSHSTGFTSNFSSHPQNFHSHVTNTMFEDQDQDHMGFGAVGAYMEYDDYTN